MKSSSPLSLRLLLLPILLLGASTFAGVRLNAPHTEPIPPKWMFGYIQSQWGDSFGYGYQSSFLDHAKALRGMANQYGAHRHPADVIVLDMFWDGLNWDWPNNMIWDNSRFPNPKQMMTDLHSMHFKLVMNYHSGGFGGDWLSHMKSDLNMGLDVPWLDFWTIGSSYEQQVWDLLRSTKGYDKRPVFMARHYARPNTQNAEGGVGTTKIPNEDEIEKTMPVHWTGDVEGTWSGFKESIEGVVYSEDGAAGGWSYLHTDTPGHSGGTDPELAARWIQFSDFTTTTRNHGWNARDVWSWGPTVEQISFNSRMLRYRLLPYIYRCAWDIWEKALPLTRAMTVAYPGEMDSLKYQYLFGDSLLVAPVYQPAANFTNKRMSVYLPLKSDWINYWDRSVSAGGQTITVDATDLAHIPLFVKRGAIIPMGPEIYWIDTTVHPDPLTLDIYPLTSGSSNTTLYDDDGETLAYQSGKRATTNVAVTNSTDGITVSISPTTGSYTGQPTSQTYLLKVNLINGAYGSVLNGTTVFTKLANAAAILADSAPLDSWAEDTTANIIYARFRIAVTSSAEIHINSGSGEYLILNPNPLSLPQASASSTIGVISNTTWSVTNPASTWLKITPLNGSKTSNLEVTATDNTAPDARSATVTVSDGTRSVKVIVTQQGLTPKNLALNKPAYASSMQSPETPASDAFDDNLKSRWSSAYNDNESITVDLQASYQLNKVELAWEAAYGRNYIIQVSDDNSSWTDIYRSTSGTGGTESINVTGSGRYVRMQGVARGTVYGYSLWEFRVFGIPKPPATNLQIDRNGDGISDVWAAIYSSPGAPSADPDGDGQSNLLESRAGTDPNDPSSHFAATCTFDAAGNVVVQWPSVAGKHYVLETSSDLATWTPLPATYNGTGSVLTVTVQNAGTPSVNRIFWHVRVFDLDSDGSGLNDWEKLHLSAIATITASAGTGGAISPAGKTYVAQGGSLVYAISANSGYSVDQVTVDGKSLGAIDSYQFAKLVGGTTHTLVASFKTNATLSVSPSTLSIPSAGGNSTVAVTSTGAWTVSNTASWLTLSSSSGNGNSSVTITAAANNSVSRTATITFQLGSLIRQVSLTQAAGVTAYYLKNHWINVYMYDAGDRVGYGKTADNDSYKWIVEDRGNGEKEFRNASTGDYIHIENKQAWAECTTRQTYWMSSRWTQEDRGNGQLRFKSAWLTSNYLHVENQTGYVQQGAAGSDWMSSEWSMEPAN